MNDQAAYFAYLVGCLVLVASGLAARRLPMGSTLKMVAAWVLIFAAGFLAFSMIGGLRSLGDRFPASEASATSGEPIRIERDPDGHYYVDAQVNGDTARFLVDSGATVTVIGKATAEGAGVELDTDFPVAVNTANGTVFMKRAKVGRLTIGAAERKDFPVWVPQGDDDINVLGMNFLASLSSWGTEGTVLVLKP